MTSKRRAEGGFTIIELMIAMLLLMVSMTGITAMVITSFRGAAHSRHLTEAAILAQDLMEDLRTADVVVPSSGSDVVDARGVLAPDGLFTREWTMAAAGALTTVTIVVRWIEDGEEHDVSLVTQRQR